MPIFVHYLQQTRRSTPPNPKFSVWGYVSFLSPMQFNPHFGWTFLPSCFETWRLYCSTKPGKLNLFLSCPKIIIRKLCTVELLDQITSGAFAIAKERHFKHCQCILSSVFEEMTSFF